MDSTARTNSQKNKSALRSKRPALKFFFLNGALHRKLHINRGKDQITAWNYDEAKRMVYSYSDVLKRKEPAFTTAEVSEMLMRSKIRIRMAIYDGHIDEPTKAYSLSTGPTGRTSKFMWSMEQVLELHEHFSEMHRGRPRKDGRMTPKALPTRRELLAMMRNETVMYIKDGDEFKPVWAAKDFD